MKLGNLLKYMQPDSSFSQCQLRLYHSLHYLWDSIGDENIKYSLYFLVFACKIKHKFVDTYFNFAYLHGCLLLGIYYLVHSLKQTVLRSEDDKTIISLQYLKLKYGILITCNYATLVRSNFNSEVPTTNRLQIPRLIIVPQ